MIAFTVPGPPVGKGRHRVRPLMRNNKPVLGPGGRPMVQTYAPEESVSYEGKVALAAHRVMDGRALLQGAIGMNVFIDVLVPQSWSARKRNDALAGRLRPTMKPDCTNVIKAIEDGLNGVVYCDDVQIVEGSFRKWYATTPSVRVEVWPISEQPVQSVQTEPTPQPELFAPSTVQQPRGIEEMPGPF